jgi:hypothetical protein
LRNARRQTPIDGDVLTLDQSLLAQALTKAHDEGFGGRLNAQEANSMRLAHLLCLRRKRPGHHPAHKLDELPPLHSALSSTMTRREYQMILR